MLQKFSPEATRFLYHDRVLETSLPGAELLLHSYAIVDSSVAQAIETVRQTGRRIACNAGCDVCCRQPIPVTPLEILLLIRFLHVRQSASVRRTLVQNIRAVQHMPVLQRPCPILLHGQCAAYVVRPMACRRYMVLDMHCVDNEDATQSRPQDVLQPKRSMLDQALALTLPWYTTWYEKVPSKQNMDEIRRFFQSITTVIQAVPWEKEV